jgi:hypothetical protein
MKQEVKGKIFVGMIVSVLAFGFATGTGIFIGANPLNTAGILDLTKQSDFPAIYTDNSNKTTSQNSNNYNSTPNEQVYVEPKTPKTSDENSSSNPQTNTSTNSSI